MSAKGGLDFTFRFPGGLAPLPSPVSYTTEKRALGFYFCGNLDPAAVQDCTKYSGYNNKCTPAISERYHQRSVLPAL